MSDLAYWHGKTEQEWREDMRRARDEAFEDVAEWLGIVGEKGLARNVRSFKADKTRNYPVAEPGGGWRRDFTEDERQKLRPIAETLAMLDGNAFFGIAGSAHDWSDQYLPEAHAIYEANGGDDGWAGEASFVQPFKAQPKEEPKA